MVEKALDEVCDKRDFELFNKLLQLVSSPYAHKQGFAEFQTSFDDSNYQTFCGT